MAIGAGFQDVRLQIELAEVQNRTTYYRQRQAMDQRRMDRENRVYADKQRVNQQELRGEQAGARMVSVLASNLPKDEMYKAIMRLQEEFPNVDLAGTDAGRGMFGYYGRLGRRAGGPGNVPDGVDLSKLHKDRNAAMNAGNTAGVAYYDKLLARENERIADQRVLAEDRRDPLDVSLEAAKGIQRPRTVVEPDLLAPMADVDAVTGAARKATRQGYDPRDVQAVAPAKGWTTDQYGKELAGMYGDILRGPGDKKPTPEELRAENTREAYEKGKKMGYWK